MAVSKDLVIGLAGLGTVGSGLVQLLKNNAAEIEQRTGKKSLSNMLPFVISMSREKFRKRRSLSMILFLWRKILRFK